MNELTQTFESIKPIDDQGNEFWSARELSKLLDYSEYRHFQPVIEKAKVVCAQSDKAISDHFEEILDMVKIGSGAMRKLSNIKLSRYACYLIVQNGDPSKPVIAAGQTYFDVGQKVRQTIAELGGTMPEDLPTPDKSVKTIETHLKKLTNKDKK